MRLLQFIYRRAEKNVMYFILTIMLGSTHSMDSTAYSDKDVSY